MPALENEQHGGSDNGTLLTAQDIDGSFIGLGTGSAERGAVLGRVGRTLYAVDRGSGLLLQYDAAGVAQSSIQMTVDGNNVFAAYDLDVDPTTDVVYALVGYDGVDAALVTLDLSTGVGTAIADVNAGVERFADMAFDAAGHTLWTDRPTRCQPRQLVRDRQVYWRLDASSRPAGLRRWWRESGLQPGRWTALSFPRRAV